MPSEINKARTEMAARLKESREYVGLSQEEVAQILKIPRTAVSLMESGERKVDALEIKALAKLYQRTVEYLTDATQPNVPEEVQHLARTASKLKPEDLKELNRFAQFLQAKAKTNK
jgi:transcriptional regulator with XRE-family HTH domain